MNTQFKISILAAMIATLGACSKKSTAADPAPTPVVQSGSLIVSATSTVLAASGTTTITVSGGSGTYVTATASYGTVVAATATSFTYTAPATVTSTNEMVTITDTNGLSGSAYITLTGATTTAGSTSCSGSYTTNVGGTAGTITLVAGSGGTTAGYLSMFGYIYPLYGSCVVSGTTGTVSLNEPFFNSTYSGTISVSGGKINISGTAYNSSTTTPATWTASSTTALSTATPPTTNSCQGNYSGTIGPNAGTMKMTHDGAGRIAGVLTIQGGYYAVTGTCSSTAVSFTNITTGSTYTGTVSMSGASTVSMSGSFTYSGTPYTWSMSK